MTLHLPDLDVTAVAHVLVPSPDAAFGVISDIDDTIVHTNATSLLGMARSIIRNAASRLPFEGVADLYRALHVERNPIFYVSSSPWNLYELLHDFMEINGIPHGPMFLQDWGIDESTLILASHTEHKLAQIQTLVDYYPELKFVLIGDSGQHDPEIYLQRDPGASRTHPRRVHPRRHARPPRPRRRADHRGARSRRRGDALRARLRRGAGARAAAGIGIHE